MVAAAKRWRKLGPREQEPDEGLGDLAEGAGARRGGAELRRGDGRVAVPSVLPLGLRESGFPRAQQVGGDSGRRREPPGLRGRSEGRSPLRRRAASRTRPGGARRAGGWPGAGPQAELRERFSERPRATLEARFREQWRVDMDSAFSQGKQAFAGVAFAKYEEAFLLTLLSASAVSFQGIIKSLDTL